MGMWGAYCWLGQLLLVGGELHSLSSPQSGLKPMLGRAFPRHVAPTLASKILEGEWVLVTSCTLSLTLGLWLPWSLPGLPMPSAPCSVDSCRPELSGQGHTYHCGSLGNWGVPLPLHPCPLPHSWGLPGALEGLLPCAVWVSVVINLAICCAELSCSSQVSCHCSPSPHIFLSFFIFAYSLPGNNH